jgi:ribose 1,5-bisphosphate isomerase
MNFLKTAKAIRRLEIQGAEQIALAAILSLNSCRSLKDFNDALNLLGKSRPTEPCLRNALFFVQHKIDKKNFKDSLMFAVNYCKEYFNSSNLKIIDFGVNRIMKEKVIFTHCHSSTVTQIIINASNIRKNIVHNTETRPFMQGRITAKELAEAGITVRHFVDSAARIAIKDSDIVLLGCDAIAADGHVINKIGSEIVCEIADRHEKPVYICTVGWKFDGKTAFGFEETLEERFKSEVWDKPPKNVEVSNIVFERIKPKLITGIISEFGICTIENFISEVKRNYPWIF